MSWTRRDVLTRLLPAAAVPLIGGLTACSASAGEAGTPASPAQTGASATAAGPAVITHKFGQTTVPAGAQRVATVGWNDQDFVLPLGIVPVIARPWFEEYDSYPWVRQSTAGLGVPTFKGDEINYEAVAATQPEVILAIYEELDQAAYDKLSAIAPTIAQPAEYPAWETPWNIQQLITGEALGRWAQAQDLVDQVQAAIDQAKADHPEFAGKVLVEDYGPENGGHYLIPKGDPRRALFDSLGFEAQAEEGDLSEEKLALLDRDVLFVVGATKSQLAKSKVFSQLPVVKEDRTLYTTFESNLAGALSYSGPLALTYALDKLGPQLANALNGRPVADLANA